MKLYEGAAKKLNYAAVNSCGGGGHSGCTYMTMVNLCQAFFSKKHVGEKMRKRAGDLH